MRHTTPAQILGGGTKQERNRAEFHLTMLAFFKAVHNRDCNDAACTIPVHCVCQCGCIEARAPMTIGHKLGNGAADRRNGLDAEKIAREWNRSGTLRDDINTQCAICNLSTGLKSECGRTVIGSIIQDGFTDEAYVRRMTYWK